MDISFYHIENKTLGLDLDNSMGQIIVHLNHERQSIDSCNVDDDFAINEEVVSQFI